MNTGEVTAVDKSQSATWKYSYIELLHARKTPLIFLAVDRTKKATGIAMDDGVNGMLTSLQTRPSTREKL